MFWPSNNRGFNLHRCVIPEEADHVILSAAKNLDCYSYLCNQALAFILTGSPSQIRRFSQWVSGPRPDPNRLLLLELHVLDFCSGNAIMNRESEEALSLPECVSRYQTSPQENRTGERLVVGSDKAIVQTERPWSLVQDTLSEAHYPGPEQHGTHCAVSRYYTVPEVRI